MRPPADIATDDGGRALRDNPERFLKHDMRSHCIVVCVKVRPHDASPSAAPCSVPHLREGGSREPAARAGHHLAQKRCQEMHETSR